MATVSFTQALKRFYPHLSSRQIEATTVQELLEILDIDFPGLKDYLLDDQGKLRQHVNIFIGEDMIRDKEQLTDKLKASDEVFIFQALSGG